jgi:hypothetical protein
MLDGEQEKGAWWPEGKLKRRRNICMPFLTFTAPILSVFFFPFYFSPLVSPSREGGTHKQKKFTL